MTCQDAIARARDEIDRAEAGLTPPPPDPRDFWTRLAESLAPWLGVSFRTPDKPTVEVGVSGRAEF